MMSVYIVLDPWSGLAIQGAGSYKTVTYLHPKVPRHTRILPFQADSAFCGMTILEQLHDTYPDLCDYLKDSIPWNISETVISIKCESAKSAKKCEKVQ